MISHKHEGSGWDEFCQIQKWGAETESKEMYNRTWKLCFYEGVRVQVDVNMNTA